MEIDFELTEKDYIALCDLLKVSNVCESGGQAKGLIENGQVKVDGSVETRKKCKVRSGQIVQYAQYKISIY